jgi:CRISPR-associated protein Cst2
MRGNILVDADRIGKSVDEFTYRVTPILSDSEIAGRRAVFIDSLKYLNGGAKQSRNMEDLSPKFVVAVNQKVGTPILLNSISLTEDNSIVLEPILEVLESNREVINSVTVGITSGIFSNEDEVREKFENVTTVNMALDSLK